MIMLLPIYLYSIYSTPTFRSMNSPRPVHVKMYIIFFSIQTLETQSVQAEKCCSVPKKP